MKKKMTNSILLVVSTFVIMILSVGSAFALTNFDYEDTIIVEKENQNFTIPSNLIERAELYWKVMMIECPHCLIEPSDPEFEEIEVYKIRNLGDKIYMNLWNKLQNSI